MTPDTIQVVEIREAPARGRQNEAADPPRPRAFVRAGRAVRRAIARNRWVDLAYRTLVGLIGTVLVILGLIIVPLPGPGWLIVFGGLAVLATEFGWAQRLAHALRVRLERFWAWWKARRAARRA
ncbi:TIGR02611 family protein [Microbacterium suaedae]|uniref:TIGR02611 family protein n=1 Tax=Microbacterium suaedae TaxID=2067813 RepID=UPI000DA13A2B|nr:TIGR02611 family protein [Microbacterium suaedae]